ncbi:PhnD/SsuA/transferrin family substrate-binding protein [Oceanisphaera avium]|uniref:PhnD/SsuA/transferrin family substrate-binding protein n=1 Tax=Oceanisphaera avium TaxID=1903694 RepID=UPI0018E03DA8|nr:PhnD/SsuA/transferrin family substrate-binding protein [Oceanisphaera avium]
MAGLTLFLLSSPAVSQSYQVGILAPRGESHSQAEWAPTLTLLNRRFSEHEFIAHYLTQTQLDAALELQQLDFVVTNPMHFMLSHGQQLNWLVSYLDSHYGQARASVAGTLWVRGDSDIIEPEQLSSYPVAAVHERAFGGYLMVADQLRRRGIFPENLDIEFHDYPLDSLVYALEKRSVAAVMLPSCVLEDMAGEGLINLADFSALMVQSHSPCMRSTPLYPGWSFASVGDLDESLLRSITQTLLNFEVDNRPQWGAPVRLDEVAQLLMDWQLAPRASPMAHWQLLSGFIEQHWPWLSGFMLLLLGHLLYHSRVAVLLRRRTKECEQLHSQVQQKEQALAHARQRVLMGEMATGLAHELNQPLSAIQAYAQAGELIEDAAQRSTAFSQIVAETERGAAIIRRFRRWATEALPSAEPIDLSVLCQELVTRLAPRASAQGVVIKVQGLGATASTLFSVRLAIEQILNNLLNNALEAHARQLAINNSHQGWIKLELSQCEKAWQIAISDNAGGIDAAIIETLQHNMPASHYHGLGIGLLVSHRLVLRLQAKMRINNIPHGTQVCVSFSESASFG